MLISISQIVLPVSLVVVIFIIFRKIPTLVKLTPEGQVVYPSIISKQGGEILNRIKGFSLTCFLRKILVRMRIITMKGENGISKCIEKLKKNSPEANAGGSDEYWEQLKK